MSQKKLELTLDHQQRASSYSDLVYIGDGMFACLMERGDNSEIEQMAFSIFSYNEVKKDTEE